MTNGASPRALSTELWTGLAFLTRLPIARGAPATGADVAQASWSFPVIGAGIGLLAGLVYWVSFTLDLSPFVSALLAVATTMLVTGCLHEDGLADTIDGFGGGRRASASSRSCATAGSAPMAPARSCFQFCSRRARSRASAILHWRFRHYSPRIPARAPRFPSSCGAYPPARPDGLSADAGRPPSGTPSIAALLGFVALVFGLGFGGAIIATLLLAAAVGLLALLCMRQIGGQTGDVLGAVEQTGEILILLVASAWL